MPQLINWNHSLRVTKSTGREYYGGVDRALGELTQVSENLEYFFSSPLENSKLLHDLYINKGLSASQIGKKYRHSKTFVLDLLERFNIEKRPVHENGHWTATPAFGFRDSVRKRRCDNVEQKIIQKILAMKSEKMSLRSIANALDTEGIPARQGTKWHPQKIKRILLREEQKH